MTAKESPIHAASGRQKKIIIPFRPLIRWLIRLRRSPRAIASGFALGTFIAFSPTIGFQFIIVFFLATLFNVNRAAALTTIWITNVATLAPIYTFNYWVGSFILSGPSVSEVYGTFIELAVKLMRMDIWNIQEQFGIIINIGSEIILPLVLGSVLVGGVAAGIVYLFSMSAINYLLARKAIRSKLKHPTRPKDDTEH